MSRPSLPAAPLPEASPSGTLRSRPSTAFRPGIWLLQALAFIGIPLLLGLAALELLARQATAEAQHAEIQLLREILTQTAARGHLPTALTALFERLSSLPWTPARFARQASALLRRQPGVFDLFLFDAQGRRVSIPGVPDTLVFASQKFLEALRREDARVPAKLIQGFAGNPRVPARLRASPGLLVDLLNGDRRTWGGWWTLRDRHGKVTGHLIVFAHRAASPPDQTLEQAVARAASQVASRFHLGWYDPLDPGILRPLGASFPADLVSTLPRLSPARPVTEVDGRPLAVHLTETGTVLFGLARHPPRPVTDWRRGQGLLLVGGLLALVLSWAWSPLRSLRTRLILQFLVGGGIPLAVFLGTVLADRDLRERLLVARLQDTNLEILIRLDQDLPTVYTPLLRRYRATMAALHRTPLASATGHLERLADWASRQRGLAVSTGLPQHRVTRVGGRLYLVSASRGTFLDGYVLFVARPYATIQAAARELTGQAALLAGLMLVVSGLVAAGTSRFLLGPITNLQRGLEALRQRDFRHFAPPGHLADLAVVTDRFNQIMARLGELQVARSIQEALWPRAGLAGPGWRVAGACRTATHLGGDHHDWFRCPDGSVLLAIGDVAGHGIPSALVGAAAKALLALTAPLGDPAAILAAMNRGFLDQAGRAKPMSFWVGLFDPTTRRLRFANAGHNFPLAVRPTGELVTAGTPGYPLGTRRHPTYTAGLLDLTTGGRLHLYSDGLIEAHDRTDQPYGYDRFADTASDLLPPGLDRPRAEPFAHQAAQTGEPLRRADGSLVVVLTTAGPHVLLGQVPPPSPTLPVGALAAWLLTANLALVMPAPGRWPRPALAAFLIASLGVAAGLPILVTALFWMRFTTTLTATAEAEELARLGEALVQIDNRFPILLRRRQREFRALLREFERTQALGPLLDRLAIMELGCEFDNGFLISSAGAMLRQYSRMATHHRPFVLLPKDRRRQALQDQLNAGLRPHPAEVELMLEIDLATASLLRTWNFHLKDTEAVSHLMGTLGKVLITGYNQEVLGLAPTAPDQPEDPASVLYGGLFESSAADLKSQLLANLGTFVRAGSGPSILHLYFDILRDALGHGAYALYSSITRSGPRWPSCATCSGRRRWSTRGSGSTPRAPPSGSPSPPASGLPCWRRGPIASNRPAGCAAKSPPWTASGCWSPRSPVATFPTTDCSPSAPMRRWRLVCTRRGF
ncbi:MAG: Serine phosphatase RsbU, regulator of sigma subunit [Candidatus Ozemobacter sibiricus]|uniref:Serine phosphatase RsbU, regulator of sigma subunit n=1 Tax=Candidatus Ozemobacter sibiricus TaxID=2268124 RepID=A0A367ZMR4_9BACT|nr:MAG: Serine phosphatase RsbU, regulator of sigma subunit [Candidatus Ozemobacter sibiricus]